MDVSAGGDVGERLADRLSVFDHRLAPVDRPQRHFVAGGDRLGRDHPGRDGLAGLDRPDRHRDVVVGGQYHHAWFRHADNSATVRSTVARAPTVNRLSRAVSTAPVKRGSAARSRPEHFADRRQRRHQPRRHQSGLVGDRPQAPGERVAHVDGAALLVDAGHIAHPSGHPEGEAVDRSAVLQPVADRPEQALRQLLRPVHGDLPRPMLQRRVAEPLDQRGAIGGEVEAGERRQGRRRFLRHQAFDQPRDPRLADRGGDGLVAHQPSQIGQCRMRSIEEPQFHQLIGFDVVDELGALAVPGRAAEGEVVLDHPLDEGLRHQRPSVLEPEGLRYRGAVGVGGRRHDAVDHGRGEAHFAGDPFAEVGIDQFGETGDQTAQGVAVGRQVVAGEHGEGRRALGATARETCDQRADRGLRSGERREVVADVGIVLAQPPGRRIVAVALLGDGERDDAHPRVGEPGDQRRRILRCDDHPGRGADHPAVGARSVDRRDGVEPVLRTQRIAGVGRAQGDAEDAPAGIFGEQRVGVDRLMGAMEGADPEMDDAGGDGAPIVGGTADRLRQTIESGFAETIHGGPQVFERVRTRPSKAPTATGRWARSSSVRFGVVRCACRAPRSGSG